MTTIQYYNYYYYYYFYTNLSFCIYTIPYYLNYLKSNVAEADWLSHLTELFSIASQGKQ